MKHFYFIVFLLVPLLHQAQQHDSTVTPIADDSAEVPKPDPSVNYYHRGAVAINFGLIGGGLEYAHNWGAHINLRARVNYFTIQNQDLPVPLDGQEDVSLSVSADQLSFDLLWEYLPFKRSSFKLVGGVSYINTHNTDLLVEYDGSFTFGEITLTSEDIGNINARLDYAGIAPYVGFGFGRAVPKRRVGFGFEIGTYYAGSPDVKLTATGMLEDSASNEEQLKKNLKDYSWLPFLQFRLAVRL